MSLSKFRGDKEFNRKVLSLAVPLMLQQLVTAGANLIDNLMVGQIEITGVAKGLALAGVVTVNRMYIVALYGLFGMMGAVTLFIAQFYGAKDEKHLKQSFRFGIVANLTFVLIILVLGSIFPTQCLRFFTQDPVIIEQGVAYMKVALFTLPPLAIILAIGNTMRSIGDVKTPISASVIGMIVKVIFNYLLIFGYFGFPRLGVVGAATATLIARIVEMIIILTLLKLGDYAFKTRILDIFKIELKLAKKIIIKGLPLVSNEIFWSLGLSTLYKFYSSRGSDVMVAYGINGTVSDLFFVLFGGMATATTVLVAQKLGANKLEEAKRDAYRLIGFAVKIAMVFGCVMFLTSYIVPYWYDVTDTQRVLAQNLIRIVSFVFWVYMLSTQCYFILRAGGDTLATLFMDSCYMWFVNIVVVGCLTYFTDFNIIVLYLFGQSTDVLKMAISYGLIKRGHWIKNLTNINEDIGYDL